MTKEISDASFENDVLKAQGPVLVDFWASWCAPCKMLSPTLDALATAMGDRLTVTKISLDDNSVIPQRFGVRSVPTLMLFKDGEMVSTKVGALSQNQLTSWVNDYL